MNGFIAKFLLSLATLFITFSSPLTIAKEEINLMCEGKTRSLLGGGSRPHTTSLKLIREEGKVISVIRDGFKHP